MAVVVGIDEAGLGPILGPLVVSAVAMEVPDDQCEADLWDLLSPAVCRAGRGLDDAVAIDDSKKLYSGLRGSGGLRRLERGVLSFLESGAYQTASLSDLLSGVAQGCPVLDQGYPWYDGADLELPRELGAHSVSADANRLRETMRRAGVALRSARCEIVPAGELNQLLDSSASKSDLLFEVTSRHLRGLSERWPERRVLVHVDRHGARKHYRGPLQAALEGSWIWIEEEGSSTSRYRIEREGSALELDFTVGCETRHLPVALASMISKYVRELLLTLLNRFWEGQVPGVAPTAGYAVDGRRFFAEIKGRLDELEIDQDLILRRR